MFKLDSSKYSLGSFLFDRLIMRKIFVASWMLFVIFLIVFCIKQSVFIHSFSFSPFWLQYNNRREFVEYQDITGDMRILNGVLFLDDRLLTGDDKLLVETDWKHDLLKSKLVSVDKKTLHKMHPLLLWDDFLVDDHNYFFFWFSWWNLKNRGVWISKDQIPDFQFIGVLGEQYIAGEVGYSSWYLVVPPYKFEVDKGSFTPYFQSFWDNSLIQTWVLPNNYIKTDGKQYCQNGGIQYQNCIWSDKSWMYRWEFRNDRTYYLLRERKQSDFKLLSIEDLKWLVTQDSWLDIVFVSKNDYFNSGEQLGDFPMIKNNIWYKNNFIYLSLPGYGTWAFSVDAQTLKYEEKEIQLPDDEYPTDYSLLHDKNYYYQLVYHNDNGYYELKRIKKSRFALWDSLRSLFD